ncbi:MAG: shikimate kinase [Bacteroidales bacterium]|nr:shikimate kinase [Bacteroidales bacterium]
MMRIFLIGFMASGKSTIGKKLANKLNLPFVDLDTYIEEKFNTTIRFLMYEKGQEEFRVIEKEALSEVIEKYKDAIISTGGGTPCFFDNMEKMRKNGNTIYLEMDVPTLVNRLLYAKKDRPLIWGKSKEDLTIYATELINKRKSDYEQADFKVDGKNLNVKTLVDLIHKEVFTN